ncbi:MAG: hypothetical protein AAF501_10115, partial [Pseudomonadota bacterium]
GDRESHSEQSALLALARIRAGHLFWPVPRDDAVARTEVILTPWRSGWRLASGQSLSAVRPETIRRIRIDGGGRIPPFAVLAGVAGTAEEACRSLRRSRWICPWTGRDLSIEDGLGALCFLRDRAAENASPMVTVGLSAWKRRAVSPFLTGPHGRPSHRKVSMPSPSTRRIHWGADETGADMRMEDGFLRSVGLGVRHTPPSSLIVAAEPLHFDTRQRTGFDRLVDSTVFDEPLLARACRLRHRIRQCGLSKYNLPDARSALPMSRGREAVLVPGQVEDDASLRHGVDGPSSNIALLQRAREVFPDAFLLYKPHPDVCTGLRPGQLRTDEILHVADAVDDGAGLSACLGWCDRVATFTSLTGFEALLRGKRVTTFGRPFYAGRGLTDDHDPPDGRKHLSLDALVAAALILYPRYIDPKTCLPAPVEQIIDRFVEERRRRPGFTGQLRAVYRFLASEFRHGLPGLRRGARP